MTLFKPQLLVAAFMLSFSIQLIPGLSKAQQPFVNAGNPDITITWVEKLDSNNAIKTIYQNEDKSWSEIQVPHVSENQISSATLLTIKDGNQLLFWSETDQQNNEQNVMYKVNEPQATGWTKPMVFYDEGEENIGISLLRREQEIWVFWASTNSELPDIYYRIYSDGTWSNESLAHPANDVPDFKPTASLSPAGEVILNWVSFDLAASDYRYKEKTLSGPLDSPLSADKITDLDFVLPNFIPGNRSISVRFPNNELTQSVHLEKSMMKTN